MKNFEIKNNESGRSMIEMLGVLAIIGVLSVGGIAGYNKAMQKYRINKTIEQVTLIAGNVRTFFSNQQNYADLSGGSAMDIIEKAKLVPEEMWVTREGARGLYIDKLNSAFDTQFYLLSVIKSGYKTFAVYLQVPEEACIELATQDWNNINAAAVYIEGNPSEMFARGLTAVNGCSGSASDNFVQGCAGGATVGLPIPIDKVTNPCSVSGQYFAIEFK